MSKGFDGTENCAPHIEAIKAGGYEWVGRYMSHSAWKNLTRGEAEALSKAGIYIVSVWESAGNHARFFTHQQGLIDGAAAFAFAQAVGQPVPTPIYFAVDCDVSGGTVLLYFEGVRESLEKHGAIGEDVYSVGAYGSGDILRFLSGRGLVSYTWLAQAMGWRGSRDYADWNIKQLPSATFAGMDVDEDVAAAKGGGGWLLPGVG